MGTVDRLITSIHDDIRRDETPATAEAMKKAVDWRFAKLFETGVVGRESIEALARAACTTLRSDESV
jgi:hypothetical protein